ncbi:MAG: ATP-binding protein [Melioribacteraceae bacterium]|nr:ATP-binding protein [Melioribacteraceae bacterium]
MEDFVQNNKLILLGKLTAGLLHEIRNPLTAIKLNLDYMKMYESDLSEEMSDSIASSLEAFDRVNYIISDLLDFTRKSMEPAKVTDINDITSRSIDILHVNADKKNIVFVTELEKELPHIFLNENKILQVFLNLINNAIEASVEKSKIFIRTSNLSQNGTISLHWEVEDFGCGIKECDRQKILDGFFTSKQTGSGIGLTVCKRLLDEVGAEFGFDSKVGQGSKFFINFNKSN